MPPRNLLLIGLMAAFTVVAACWYLRPTHKEYAAAAQQHDASRSEATAETRAASAQRATPGGGPAARESWSALPRGFARNQEIERDGYELASRDLPAAWEKLRVLEDRAERAAFLRGMFFAVSARAPREALAAIKQVENRDERDLAMETIAGAWRGGVPAPNSIRRQPVRLSDAARLGMSLLNGTTGRAELAVLWAQELLTEPAERVALLGAAAAAFALKDPERIVALDATLSDEPSREIFRTQFADALRAVAGDAAWSNIRALPPGDLRDTAQLSILNAWAGADPQAAAAAIATLPSGDERTNAIAVFAESWAARDTDAAFSWAATMDAPERAAAEEAIRRSAPIGIGAVLDMSDDGYPVIRELLPGGAAARSGQLPSQSKIVAVVDTAGNAVPTHGMELGAIAGRLRGAKGTSVTMLVQIPGRDQPQTVTIARDQIIHKTARK